MTENDLGNAVAVEAELTADEMEGAAGGKFSKPAARSGFTIYQIQRGDTLIRIANKYGIGNWKKIVEWNPKITNPSLIITGDYLYIKN